MNNKFVWMSTKTRVMISEHVKKTGIETFEGQTVLMDESLQYGCTSQQPPPFFATPAQLKAWDELNETGYSAWDTDMYVGKTTLLQAIVHMMPDKTIGVFCPTYVLYERDWKMYDNCVYISDPIKARGRKFDLLVGDDVIIERDPEYKIICAFTRHSGTMHVRIR